MPNLLLKTQVAATLFMTGLIWFVQVIHYPLFASVGTSAFVDYHQAHVNQTSLVVVPVMLVELVTAVISVIRPPTPELRAGFVVGLVLLAGIWAATFLCSVPAHDILANGKDAAAIEQLVASNWLRTIGWTVRAGLVLVLVDRLKVHTGAGSQPVDA